MATILGYASCGRLDNLYLPPNHRASNGAFGGHSGAGFPGQAGGAFAGSVSGGYSDQTYPSNNLNQVPIVKFAADNNGEGSYR